MNLVYAAFSLMLLFLGGSHASDLNSALPPGRNFNLTNWYLGLPVDSSGGTSGNSASISAAQLTAGYSNANFFYTGSDGSMVFWAPVNGATTSGSSYPRSELREQISPPSNTSNWLAFGTHMLNGSCRVTQLPSSGKVIIGQIHGYTGAARPMLKLQCFNGLIEALIKTNSNFDADLKYTFPNVGLNNLITYQVHMENGLLSLSVNNSNRSINLFQTDPDWATNTLYFKAGSYCQDNSGSAAEGARVAFYTLSRSHAPSITNHPPDILLVTGSNALLQVKALGNGPLRYQWRFFSTNLPGATQSSLVITNAKTPDAGPYSVQVSDSLGSATSRVAQVSLNRPPVPESITFATGREFPREFPLDDLVSSAVDLDGDSVFLASVDPTSLFGGAIAITNQVARYQPALSFTGLDQVLYTLSDSRGATARGIITFRVLPAEEITLHPVFQTRSISNYLAVFTGTPGLTYSVDSANHPAGPWSNLLSLTANAEGHLVLSSKIDPAEPCQFYRVRYP